jgi:glyoxylate/hydroxypyruvate reductase
MVKLVFHSDIDYLEDWLPPLRRLLPELDAKKSADVSDPASIDVALIWTPPPRIEQYCNLKAILSLGAGVDQLDLKKLPKGVPLARLKDPSLTEGMKAYCMLAVLRYHRDFHIYERFSREGGPWRFDLPKPAAKRRIGILGLGELGASIASHLASAGFAVAGWARTPRQIPGVTTHHGWERLDALAAGSDILINLLPLTAETEGILSRKLFSQMPEGSYLINVGRGRHLIEDDLLVALRSGQLSGATLDVFRKEPLPPDHPFWREPNILITPHVATSANPETAAQQVVQNIERALRGETLLNQVDRDRGY